MQPSAQTAHHAAPTAEHPLPAHAPTPNPPNTHEQTDKHPAHALRTNLSEMAAARGEELTICWEASLPNHKNNSECGGEIVVQQRSPSGLTLSPILSVILRGGERQDIGDWREFSEEVEGGALRGVLCLQEDSDRG